MNTIIIVAIVAVAFVFCLGFLVILFSLIPALQQLRTFFAEAEKTSLQIRIFCQQLEKLGDQVEEKIEKTDAILHSVHKVVENTGETLHYVNQSILKRSAAWLAFLPALRLGWKIIKKAKGGR